MTNEELSPSAAARRIGATTRSVQRWIAAGRLPARRVGGRWRVASDALDAIQRSSGRGGARDAASGGADQGGGHPIRSLFVANRGEIARRIARTCERLGIRVVLPATEGNDAVDLLDIAAVVAATAEAGCGAVHPGFGFLAENADFAEAVLAAGLRWVGPPPGAIRAMGDKAAARRLATKLGVPIVPGYDGRAQSDRALRTAADRIGFPLLVKPSGGGGGKGMRVVRDPESLRDALAGARREALAAFGDERLILERLVEGGRHVEVQVLFDQHGHGVHLGERDCSTQRRHQKVLEETPSPAVDQTTRTRLTDAALRLAGAVGYASAGTCEFLLTDRAEVFFLEMNTRLQVEHPVTELVTGLDLVELQLRVAAGEALPISQAEADEARSRGGHAVEVRLYAEDAERGFLPATGRIERLHWPSGPEIRVDAGVDEGDEVTGRFDPMLAKVIAHGPDRPAALDRLAEAVDATTVLGLVTNLRFLRWLVREPVIRDGEMRVDTLDRIWPPDDWAHRTALGDDDWAAAGAELLAAGRAAQADDWAGGWRLNGPPRARLATLDAEDGGERSLAITTGTGRRAVVVGQEATPDGAAIAFLDVAGRSVGFRLAPPPDVDRAMRSAESRGGGGELVAPMPGAVVTVHRRLGDTVAAGDPIVTLEAMKMEHVVAARAAGVVSELGVQAGDQVARGQRLAVLGPASEPNAR
ncbi:MAG TPA: biotin carboxylase N-terminal domain-containing protein [Candidatus Limnocylindrales bacterium]|nr:biotin carboxylase N-terminal domain-containing protein [Candidatus Limnocylindrales bacterium]